MNSRIFLFGILCMLIISLGCINLKEIIQLPVSGESMEKEEFSQTIDISSNEQLEMSGTYAKITTDNVRIEEMTHHSSFEGAEQGSEVSFLSSTWSITSLDCSAKEVTLENSEASLTLEDGSVTEVVWNTEVTCDGESLQSITLELNRQKMTIQGSIIYIPNGFGYSLEYLGNGAFGLK